MAADHHPFNTSIEIYISLITMLRATSSMVLEMLKCSNAEEIDTASSVIFIPKILNVPAFKNRKLWQELVALAESICNSLTYSKLEFGSSSLIYCLTMGFFWISWISFIL